VIAGAAEELVLEIAVDGGSVSFNWNSNEGKFYDLVTSTDLSTAPETWEIFQGQIGITATAPLNSVTLTGPDVPKRFFAIIEHEVLPE